MEVASLTVSGITLATLFSTCIECFEYFSEGKNFDRDFKYLLVRLDLEKTQLLIWGNSNGIVRVEQAERAPSLGNPTIRKSVELALNEIRKLLSDADALEQRYGVQSTPQVKKHLSDASDLSARNLNIFNMAWTRFCVRVNPSRSGKSAMTKTRWAIHDKTKFTALLENLSNLVEGLYKIIPVPDSKPYVDLEADLALILDMEKLKLVETGLKSSKNPPLQALSRAASEIITESENGTADRRRLVEWVRDMQWMYEIEEEEIGQITPTPPPQSNRLNLKPKLDTYRPRTEGLYFVNTPQCLNRNTGTPCSPSAVADHLQMRHVHAFNRGADSTLAAYFPSFRKVGNFEPPEYHARFERLERLSEDDYNLKRFFADSLQQMIPFGYIYIHTSPCSCALSTAVAIAHALNTWCFEAVIRVDDRISCSCYPSVAQKVKAMESILNHLENEEAKPRNGAFDKWWRLPIDRLWLDQRLYMLETDTAKTDSTAPGTSPLDVISNANSTERFAGQIVVGEVEFCTPFLQAEPLPWSPRFPRECEIYQITSQHPSVPNYIRKYIGRFTARPPLMAANGTLANPQVRNATGLALSKDSKRTAFPEASPAKRVATEPAVSEMLRADGHEDSIARDIVAVEEAG